MPPMCGWVHSHHLTLHMLGLNQKRHSNLTDWYKRKH